MPYPHDEVKLKEWEIALSAKIASDPVPWDVYDTHIRQVCQVYDNHLAGVGGYVPLDWQLMKAMTWVETGVTVPDWLTAPMQIGVHGDPGLQELLTSPTGKLILPDEYKKILTLSNVPVNGNLNIQAGIGYVLKITATFGMIADPPPLDVTALLNQMMVDQKSPEAVARQEFQLGTLGMGLGHTPVTPWALVLNGMPGGSPGVPYPIASSGPSTLSAAAKGVSRTHGHTGHTAHKKRVRPSALKKHLGIVGWKPRTPQFIAKHYNAGDGNYPDKLQFALDIISGKVKPEGAPKPDSKKKASTNQHAPLRVPTGGGH